MVPNLTLNQLNASLNATLNQLNASLNATLNQPSLSRLIYWLNWVNATLNQLNAALNRPPLSWLIYWLTLIQLPAAMVVCRNFCNLDCPVSHPFNLRP
jgi:hypothetical protein